MKRWAKSYSIVDHLLLHGGYIGRLSHGALALYLFYVVVGDDEGRSYYSSRRIMQILRMGENEFIAVQRELLANRLIDYRKPNVWVNNLGSMKDEQPGRFDTARSISTRRQQVDVPTNSGRIGDLSWQVLAALCENSQSSSNEAKETRSMQKNDRGLVSRTPLSKSNPNMASTSRTTDQRELPERLDLHPSTSSTSSEVLSQLKFRTRGRGTS